MQYKNYQYVFNGYFDSGEMNLYTLRVIDFFHIKKYYKWMLKNIVNQRMINLVISYDFRIDFKNKSVLRLNSLVYSIYKYKASYNLINHIVV